MQNITPKLKHVLMPVRVILLRKKSKSPWIKFNWSVYDVLPGSGTNDSSIQPLIDDNHVDSKHTGKSDLFKVETEIDLHRAEAEAYVENLGSSDPSIYIVLRPDAPDEEPSEHGIVLESVSLSPYIIQDYEDIGEDQIEKVALGGPIAKFLEDFVSNHFKPVKFKKRQRDRKHITDLVEEGKGDPRVRQTSNIFRAPTKKKLK